MPKTNNKSFKFIKSVLLMLCVVIVITVITVGSIIFWSKRLQQLTYKNNESMPEEKHFKSILSFIINSYFFCLKILFLNWTRNENIIHRINILFFYKKIHIKNLRKIFFLSFKSFFCFFYNVRKTVFSFKSNKVFSLRFCENVFLRYVTHRYCVLHILLLLKIMNTIETYRCERNPLAVFSPDLRSRD
jgi:hypothetical protein